MKNFNSSPKQWASSGENGFAWHKQSICFEGNWHSAQSSLIFTSCCWQFGGWTKLPTAEPSQPQGTGPPVTSRHSLQRNWTWSSALSIKMLRCPMLLIETGFRRTRSIYLTIRRISLGRKEESFALLYISLQERCVPVRLILPSQEIKAC